MKANPISESVMDLFCDDSNPRLGSQASRSWLSVEWVCVNRWKIPMEAIVPLLARSVSISAYSCSLGLIGKLTGYTQKHKDEAEADEREAQHSLTRMRITTFILEVFGHLRALWLDVLRLVVGVLLEVAPEGVEVACGDHCSELEVVLEEESED